MLSQQAQDFGQSAPDRPLSNVKAGSGNETNNHSDSLRGPCEFSLFSSSFFNEKNFLYSRDKITSGDPLPARVFRMIAKFGVAVYWT